MMAWDLGFRKILLKTDWAIAVYLLQEHSSRIHVNSQLTNSIKELLKRN